MTGRQKHTDQTPNSPNRRYSTGCLRLNLFQWIFQVPVKGGIGSIVHPPIGRKNTTYIPLIIYCRTWGVICYRSHLLGEPETTIDSWVKM